MKIAIGMIVRNLISAYPLTEFLDNAEKYDHPIERVIVVYSHEADPEVIQELQRKAKVSLIRLQNYERAHMILKQLGVRFSSIQQLLFCLGECEQYNCNDSYSKAQEHCTFSADLIASGGDEKSATDLHK